MSRFFPGRNLRIPYAKSSIHKLLYKEWIYENRLKNCKIILDAGAVKAIIRRASIYPVGVLAVIGTFNSGDIVEICSESQQLIAVGNANFSSTELNKVKGLRSEEILNCNNNIDPNKIVDQDRFFTLRHLNRLRKNIK